MLFNSTYQTITCTDANFKDYGIDFQHVSSPTRNPSEIPLEFQKSQNSLKFAPNLKFRKFSENGENI